jgi:hypothetical protein
MEGLLGFAAAHVALTVIAAVVVLGVVVLAALWWYGMGVFASREERARKLPGDDLLSASDPKMRFDVSIRINAPKERVWPYLAQLGQRRGGFYSFSTLERLCGFHIYNTYEIVDEWQDMREGDFMFFHQCGVGMEVQEVKPNEYFTMLCDTRAPSRVQHAIAFIPPFALKYFGFTWNFFLFEDGSDACRLFVRCDCAFEPFKGWRKWLVIVLLGTPSVVMSRGLLKGVKKCAESRKVLPGKWLRALFTQ